MIVPPLRKTLRPLQQIYLDPQQRKQWIRRGILAAILFVGLYLVGLFIPEGFDWKIFFSKGVYP